MDVKEYDDIVRFLESKDSEQRNWPRDVLESKDGKDAKRAYRQKCEGFITEDGLLFKTKRRKKGLTSVQEEERYRVVTVDEKVRLLDTVHKDPAGGHFGVHKTLSSVVTINDKTEQFILNQCSTEVLLDVKASIEKFTSNSSETGIRDVLVVLLKEVRKKSRAATVGILEQVHSNTVALEGRDQALLETVVFPSADPEKKKASVRDSYKADPEKKKASVRDSYKADPEKKKASVCDSYKADPEKKKASARDSYKAESLLDLNGRCVVAEEIGDRDKDTMRPLKWKCTNECRKLTSEEVELVKTKRKFDHPAEELHHVPVPNSSWKQIGIDLIGPLPTTTNEPEHLKHIDARINLEEHYRAKATQNILCPQTRQKLHYDNKHNTNSIFKVRDKVLKSNDRNRHRMGGKLEKPWLGVYIIQKDLGKGRYCLKTLEGKLLKQTIHYARLKRFLDPVVDDNIMDEVEELDNSDSECAGEQEAANGKGMGDSVHHEENDNDKEQGCQNEEQQSHSPEQREIMEPVSVLEEQLYSLNILCLWRSGACTSYYEAKEDDEEFDNAELDLQQEEYALSKDIDVSMDRLL
eukprot:Em0001g3495a